jgi:hypothetical protein
MARTKVARFAAGAQTATLKAANCRIRLIGGSKVETVQGLATVNRRLEEANAASAPYAHLTEPHGKAVFVSPAAVAYIEAAPKLTESPRAASQSRKLNTRVHFIDGTNLDVVQGVAVANERLQNACAASGMLAAFTNVAGAVVFVNYATITHLTADPG